MASYSRSPQYTSNASTRVLLVEDDPTSRLLLRDFLTHVGYAVFDVWSGDEFFTALTRFQAQVIVLDLKLPKVDGFTLLHQLQQHSQWRHIPVIVVSAYAFKADQERALALGAKRYFVKPIDLIALNEAIAQELIGSIV